MSSSASRARRSLSDSWKRTARGLGREAPRAWEPEARPLCAGRVAGRPGGRVRRLPPDRAVSADWLPRPVPVPVPRDARSSSSSSSSASVMGGASDSCRRWASKIFPAAVSLACRRCFRFIMAPRKWAALEMSPPSNLWLLISLRNWTMPQRSSLRSSSRLWLEWFSIRALSRVSAARSWMFDMER